MRGALRTAQAGRCSLPVWRSRVLLTIILLWLIALGAVGSCVSAVLGCLVTCVRYDLPVPLAAKVVGGLCAPTVAVLFFLADRFAARMKG